MLSCQMQSAVTGDGPNRSSASGSGSTGTPTMASDAHERDQMRPFLYLAICFRSFALSC